MANLPRAAHRKRLFMGERSRAHREKLSLIRSTVVTTVTGLRSANVLLDRGLRPRGRSEAGAIRWRPRLAESSGRRGPANQSRARAGPLRGERDRQGGPKSLGGR